MTLHTASFRWHRLFHSFQGCGSCFDDGSRDLASTSITAGRSIRATAEIAEVVRCVGEACDRLRHHVLPFGRVLFGDAIESVEELVVRGQVLVLMTCMHRISEAMSSPTGSLPDGDGLAAILNDFPGGVDEVTRYVELEVHHVASPWVLLRRENERRSRPVISPIFVDYWQLHREAVLTAQRRLFGMMDNSRFGRFLVAGIVHPELHHVRAYCVQIATALQIRLYGDLSCSIPGALTEGRSGIVQAGTPPQPISA